MKRAIATVFMCLAAVSSSFAQDIKPSLSIYIRPGDYNYEQRLGVIPYYAVWARSGPALEQSARRALTPLFGDVAFCEGNITSDVIVWLEPHLKYIAPTAAFSARVKARFYRGDGKKLGKITATGTQESPVGSRFSDEHIQQAYDKALLDIAAKLQADPAMLHSVSMPMGEDLTKSPCAVVGIFPEK